MKRSFRDEWCTALRSGEYKQGKGRLYLQSSDSYCCLGVACRVAGVPIGEITNLLIMGDLIKDYPILSDLIATGDYSQVLAGMNDGEMGEVFAKNHQVENRSYTFAEIADWIEKNIPVED